MMDSTQSHTAFQLCWKITLLTVREEMLHILMECALGPNQCGNTPSTLLLCKTIFVLFDSLVQRDPHIAPDAQAITLLSSFLLLLCV